MMKCTCNECCGKPVKDEQTYTLKEAANAYLDGKTVTHDQYLNGPLQIASVYFNLSKNTPKDGWVIHNKKVKYYQVLCSRISSDGSKYYKTSGSRYKSKEDFEKDSSHRPAYKFEQLLLDTCVERDE